MKKSAKKNEKNADPDKLNVAITTCEQIFGEKTAITNEKTNEKNAENELNSCAKDINTYINEMLVFDEGENNF